MFRVKQPQRNHQKNPADEEIEKEEKPRLPCRRRFGRTAKSWTMIDNGHRIQARRKPRKRSGTKDLVGVAMP